MTLQETLIKFGLEPKEAKVYLASLELGPASVLQIAKKAEIKRPTAYLVLDALIEKGYVSKTQQRNKQLFIAEKPEILLNALQTKQEILQETMPMLQAIMATAKERPKITIFEGQEGLWQVYEEVFSSPEITFFGSIKDINRHFPEVIKKMAKLAQTKKPRVRDLLTSHPDDIAYAKQCISDVYEVRFLPPDLDFSIDCAIIGNKVAILAVKKDLMAVVIESKDVADSFKALHTLAWKSALPIENIK